MAPELLMKVVDATSGAIASPEIPLLYYS